MALLPKNCVVAWIEKDDRERTSSALQREMYGQAGRGQ